MAEWQMDGKPALVLLHMQNGLVGEQTFIPNWGPDAKVAIKASGMMDRVQDLLAAFRAKNLPICFVNANPAGGTGDLPKYGHIYKEQQAAGLLWKNPLMDDDFRHGLKVIPEMNLQPGEGVLTNWLLGAFTMSGLDIWLKMRDVKTIVFGGFAGHSAVFNSTIQAADYWYNVVIPRDASCVLLPRITMPGVADVKPYDKKVEEVIFDIMAPIYSLVTTTKDVIAHL